MSFNQNAFDDESVVERYEHEEELDGPEIALLEHLRGELPSWRMLDIGIGAGRTTRHFAPLVGRYVGVDYARKMVESSARRFSSSHPAFEFMACDARSLPFETASFDFVLFSFNGIDYMPAEDRIAGLREIHRVTRPGGHFVFSSHNLASIGALYRLDLTGGPARVARRSARRLMLRVVNGGARRYQSQPHAVINDGYLGFRFRTQYVRPLFQAEQLMKAGFRDIRVLSGTTGEVVEKLDTGPAASDPWLYYHCRI